MEARIAKNDALIEWYRADLRRSGLSDDVIRAVESGRCLPSDVAVLSARASGGVRGGSSFPAPAYHGVIVEI